MNRNDSVSGQCGFWRSKISYYHDVVIKTCYMGSVPIKLKKLEDSYLLETRHNKVFIKVIDAQQYNLNPNVSYPMVYLLGLDSIKSNIAENSYNHDIIFNVYNYLLFLEKYNIEFKYDNLVVLAGVPNLDNAFWNGSYLTFGGGSHYNPLTSSMIVGHELTHAVIQSINDLEYKGESGALNESFADVFGVTFELFIHEQHHYMGWELGSETGYLLRDMKDPHRKWQPKVMHDQYYCDPTADEDNGGVHVNSGITNHIFVCVSEVIGITNAFLLFYGTLTKLQKFASFKDFSDTMLLVNAYRELIQRDILIKILRDHIL